MQHDVVANGHASLGWVAGEGAMLWQQASSVQQVDEQGAQFLEDLGADGVEEVAQARGGRGVSLSKAAASPPTGPVLTGQQLGQLAPPALEFTPQADTQEKGNGIERDLTFGTPHIVDVSQVVAHGREVDETQGDFKAGQLDPLSGTG
jgi:hypothetical protein